MNRRGFLQVFLGGAVAVVAGGPAAVMAAIKKIGSRGDSTIITPYWNKRLLADFAARVDRGFVQEYPAADAEAFISSGRMWTGDDWTAIAESIRNETDENMTAKICAAQAVANKTMRELALKRNLQAIREGR